MYEICMCAYIHIYVYKHECMCACIHICLYVGNSYIHTCMHAYIHMHTHVCVPIYVPTCKHRYMHAHMSVDRYMHTYVWNSLGIREIMEFH